ncbi:hypothetical protein [Actinomadura parmotrematis]|uniref:Uncharacterized protein n=1 Tax=Actinomadura parmotrematis TaxID=2864039 RepID=A0ABS7FWA9_9ACTN|nr:hypothetical protein [Actinomadura parmotrematis]MBW8484716.1 hypothetical protein [Actinomadura parmotrematis]
MRGPGKAGAAVLLAACALLAPSSTPHRDRPFVDAETTHQLVAAARTLLQLRSSALVERGHHERRPPAEILGVVISPRVAQAQERAVQELETRNRAPVAGGPPYLDVRTTLGDGRAVRRGDRITLEATERTAARYRTGELTQSVRRRFDFAAVGTRLVLIGEGLLDPGARPLNDPVGQDR